MKTCNHTIYKEKKLFKGFESKNATNSRNIENIKEKLQIQSKNSNLNIINYIVEGLADV